MHNCMLAILFTLLPIVFALPTVNKEIHRSERSLVELLAFEGNNRYPGGHSRGQFLDFSYGLRSESIKSLLQWLKELSSSFGGQYLSQGEKSFIQNGPLFKYDGWQNNQSEQPHDQSRRHHNQGGSHHSQTRPSPSLIGQSFKQDEHIPNFGKEQLSNSDQHTNDEHSPSLNEQSPNQGLPTPNPIGQSPIQGEQIPIYVEQPSNKHDEVGGGQSRAQAMATSSGTGGSFAQASANANSNLKSL